MFRMRNSKNRVNKMHESALKLVYHDSHYLSFDELLLNMTSVIINQRNLHFLATETFHVENVFPAGLTENILWFCS